MSAIPTTRVPNIRTGEREVKSALTTTQLVHAEANASRHDQARLLRVADAVHRVQSSTSACVLGTAIVLFVVFTWIAAGWLGWRGDPSVVAAICGGLLAAFVLVLPRDNEVN